MVDVKSFKYSTIKNYLNIVKHLHCANDFNDPIHGVWLIQETLKGAKRELGDAQEAATPIQPCHLLLIRSALCLDLKEDLLISETYLCTRPRLVYPKYKSAHQRLVIPELDKNYAVS